MRKNYWEHPIDWRTFVKSVAGASLALATAGSAGGREDTHVKRFDRSLIETHFAESGQLVPDFIGSVELGEPFVIETANTNDANGPVAIEGVQAGDDIAVEIEKIEIVGPVETRNCP